MVESRETKQKKIIQKEVDSMNFFFTAEELYGRVSKHDKNLGIATVYRFLRDLKKNRKIHLYTCDRKSLYSTKNLNHNHFICEICEKKEHLNIDKIDFIKKFVSGDICHFQIEVSGICESCKKHNIYK